MAAMSRKETLLAMMTGSEPMARLFPSALYRALKMPRRRARMMRASKRR
jgi:hypothetical protein